MFVVVGGPRVRGDDKRLALDYWNHATRSDDVTTLIGVPPAQVTQRPG